MKEKSENLQVVDTDDLIGRLSSDDCNVAEPAFEALRLRIEYVKSRIYDAANRDNDCNAQSYLVELLGESRDPEYFPFIAEQLKSQHAKVRLFAHAALFRLGTPQSRELHYTCDLRSLLSSAIPHKKNG